MGGLADGYKVIYTGCGLGMFRCRQLAQLPVAGIPSKPRYLETAGLPYMECGSAFGLTAYLGMSA